MYDSHMAEGAILSRTSVRNATVVATAGYDFCCLSMSPVGPKRFTGGVPEL